MSKQKRAKLAVTVTPEKTRQDKPFVQVEGKLTEEQLEAIAGGRGSYSNPAPPPSEPDDPG